MSRIIFDLIEIKPAQFMANDIVLMYFQNLTIVVKINVVETEKRINILTPQDAAWTTSLFMPAPMILKT